MPFSTKEKRAEYMKEYREKNKDKVKKQSDEYKKTPKGKKTSGIYNWKRRGLIHDDYDALYDNYLKAENCEECGVPFGIMGDGSGTPHSSQFSAFK